MSTDSDIAPTGITFDNFHLSKPIQVDAARYPVSLCTDPKVLEFVAAATSANTLRAYDCQSALDRDPVSASKRDPLVLRFERLAFAPSELAGVAETGRARVGV